jgi:integrase
MTGRRHFGNARKLPSGRWQASYWWEGQRHIAPDTFKAKADALAYLATAETDVRRGAWVDLTAKLVFGPYATKWIETRLARGRPLTPATRQGYRALMRRNIEPTFGKTQLRRITPERVREWYSDVLTSASADQAAKSYRLLRAILNTAKADRLIGDNPCQVRGGGIEHAPERPILDTGTVLDLMNAIAPRLRAFVLLAGFGTLRSGELLGLERRDIDPLRSVVYVRREAQEIAHVRDEHGDIVEEHGREVSDPKTEAGKRVVTLPRFVMDELATHLAAYVGPEPDALMFTRSTGRYLRRQDLSDAWRAACTAVGLTSWSKHHPEGIRPHDLRHHAATTTARIPGVTTKELMARLGHSSPRAALIYQHATEERDRAIADQLDTLIASTRREPRAKVVNLALGK